MDNGAWNFLKNFPLLKIFSDLSSNLAAPNSVKRNPFCINFTVYYTVLHCECNIKNLPEILNFGI